MITDKHGDEFNDNDFVEGAALGGDDNDWGEDNDSPNVEFEEVSKYNPWGCAN